MIVNLLQPQLYPSAVAQLFRRLEAYNAHFGHPTIYSDPHNPLGNWEGETPTL